MESKIIIILLLSVVFLGCLGTKYVYVERYHPILEAPAKPVLIPIPKSELELMPLSTYEKILERDRLLKQYGDNAVGVIELYNNWAREKNREAGFE